MDVRIVERPAFEAVGWGLRASNANGDNFVSIPKFWQACHADGRFSALAAHSGPLGILGLCGEADPATNTFTYLIAVEGRAGVSYPAGTQRMALPAGRYAVFTAVGAMPDAIQEAWKFAFGQWLPGSEWQHAGTPDFEVYPDFPEGDERGDPTSVRCVTEVWIPLRPKAAKS